MGWSAASAIGWLFDRQRGASEHLIPRWLFLRALGLIYFSAFFSLVFQIRGLIGPAGIQPASSYLQEVVKSLVHWQRLWFAPTLLWWSSGSHMLIALCWAGMIASLLLVLNLWPRGMLVICFVCFLSFVSAAQDFSPYYLRHLDFAPAWAECIPHREPACFYCDGSGFASTSNLVW